MASMASSDSPMEASRLRSSRMLRPASTRIRVFSVARRAALPELPLASTQNFTMVFSPNLQNTPNPTETESGEFVSVLVGQALSHDYRVLDQELAGGPRGYPPAPPATINRKFTR